MPEPALTKRAFTKTPSDPQDFGGDILFPDVFGLTLPAFLKNRIILNVKQGSGSVMVLRLS